MADSGRADVVIEIWTEFPVPDDQQETYAMQYVWVWTQVSAIIAGINGAVGGSGGLALNDVDMTLKPGPIDKDENDGRCEWAFILNLVIRLV
jgi:hypothetical protein